MAYRPHTAPTARVPSSRLPPSAAARSALQQAAPGQQAMPQPSCPEHDAAAALDCPAVFPAVCLPAAPAVGSAPAPPPGGPSSSPRVQCAPALRADLGSDSCAPDGPGSAAAAKEVKTAFPKKKGFFKRSFFPPCTPALLLQSESSWYTVGLHHNGSMFASNAGTPSRRPQLSCRMRTRVGSAAKKACSCLPGLGAGPQVPSQAPVRAAPAAPPADTR